MSSSSSKSFYIIKIEKNIHTLVRVRLHSPSPSTMILPVTIIIISPLFSIQRSREHLIKTSTVCARTEEHVLMWISIFIDTHTHSFIYQTVTRQNHRKPYHQTMTVRSLYSISEITHKSLEDFTITLITVANLQF